MRPTNQMFTLQTSIINKGCLKPIKVTFNAGWKFIKWMIPKIVYLILTFRRILNLFITTSNSNIMKPNIILLHVSSKSMITNEWNLIPAWISKKRLWQGKKKGNKTSNNAELYAQKLCAIYILTKLRWKIKCQDSIQL